MYTPRFILDRLFRSVLPLMLIAGLLATGCDSGDEDQSDLERFLGTWELTRAADMGGTRDQTAVFESLGVLTLEVGEDGTFILGLNYIDVEEEDLSLGGDYTVNEAIRTLILLVDQEGLQVPLSFTYTCEDDETALLYIDSTTLRLLLGSAVEIEGTVELTIEKFIDD
jgi:hypothetical protein